MSRGGLRIGVDTGGTFTDVLAMEEGRLRSWKLPSTPGVYERAVLQGAAEVAEGTPAELIHSTTVATNALLEGKGARTALVATRGFADLLEIGRQARPDLYALFPQKPPPVPPRDLRFELTERVNARGEVVEALSEAELEGLPEVLRAAGVESVAVVFLFSFLRPDHERQVGEVLRARGFEVSLSHEVLPEFREVERASTTAANARVGPVMQAYLTRLARGAEAARLSPLRIVRSNGGTLSPSAAGTFAVQTLLSGPAAGVRGAMEVARAGDPDRPCNLITFDMGGTSTDVALIQGRPQVSTELRLGDMPIAVPMYHIHTVGAGGGSLARVDEGGALRVGPESAGAEPGPACYGRGGGPTVTDAHVVLGHLHPDRFLRGRMRLDVEAAREAMRRLGEAMGGEPPEAAARGVLRVANVAMENAVRVISVRRGYDPGGFTLVGFGGAGGLHVFALAEALGIPRVLAPRHPGVLSALGAAFAPPRRDAARTVMLPWSGRAVEACERVCDALKQELRKGIEAEGGEAADWEFRLSLAMRYRGQSHELTVELDDGGVAGADRAFEARHRERYGTADPEAVPEVVTVRVEAEWPVTPAAWPEFPRGGGRTITGREWIRREDLRGGDRLVGPCVVVEDFHTLVLPSGWSLRPDRIGNLVGTRTTPDENEERPDG